MQAQGVQGSWRQGRGLEDHAVGVSNPQIASISPFGFSPHDAVFLACDGTDAEAETPILQPPDRKKRLIGKNPDAGKDWRKEEKGVTEDEMVGWHH